MFFFTKRMRVRERATVRGRVVRIERLAFFRERRGVSRVAFRRLSWSGDAREGRREGRRILFLAFGFLFRRRAPRVGEKGTHRWTGGFRFFFGGFLATNAFLAKSSSSLTRNTPSRVSAAARASAAAETFKRHKASCSFRLVSAAAARLRSAAAFARARSSLTASVATRASASAARACAASCAASARSFVAFEASSVASRPRRSPSRDPASYASRVAERNRSSRR